MRFSGFVLRKEPFVCRKIPFVIPVIPVFIPSVRNEGFTLIELIVTLTIAAILIAFAGPALRNVILNQQLTTQTNDFLADLNFARSEAIKRGTNVTVCRQGGTEVSPSCNSSASWNAGRVIFVDTDADSTIDSGETVLRVREALAANTSMSVTGSVALPSVVYAATGLTTMTTGDEASLLVCDSRRTLANTITVNFTGRVNSTRTTSSTCP